MRKTFCSRGGSSIHNGVFIADIPLQVADLVKIQVKNSRPPHHVTRFSSDHVIDDISHYDDSEISSSTSFTSLPTFTNTTFIDIITNPQSFQYYVLGISSNTYFILTANNRIPLATFQSPTTPKGNLAIYNGKLYALIPHGGSFISSSRPINISQSGVLFTIDLNNFKISGIRGINLGNNFMMFGGSEMGSEPLYLLNDNIVSRFNPSTSHSWSVHLTKQQLSASVIKGMVIMIACDEINALDANNGNILWTFKLDTCSKICSVATSTTLYILQITDISLTIMQADITQSGLTLISQKILLHPNKPNLYCISIWSKGYIIWTDTRIYILNNNNEILSTVTINNISVDRTSRIIPRYSPNNIPVIINGTNTVQINDINTFSDSSDYAGIFVLREDYPQRAGIVTDVLDNNQVYVVTSGTIVDILKNLTPNRTYIINKSGVLTGSYHNINQGKPFLIAGMEGNAATIIY